MKKIWMLPVLVLLLAGCGVQETFETVSDVHALTASAAVYTIELSLPETAAQPAMESAEGGKLYLCDGYTVTVQTGQAGDLNRTLRDVTGFEEEELTLVQTTRGGFKCWQCAWTAVGEGADQICRTVILDDGNSHHAVTVMGDYTKAGDFAKEWQHILGSACLVSTG